VVVFLLILILVVLLLRHKLFWKNVLMVAVASALLGYYALVLALFGVLVFLVELTFWLLLSDLAFTQWFWKYAIFTLWLPAPALLIGFVVYKRREYAKSHQASLKTKVRDSGSV